VKEKGAQVITDVDKPAFEKKVQPVYDNYVKKYGKDLLEGIRAAAKKK
jgi:TRAP-type C4-dicarboxylate transport system substrate-binding protein